MNNGKRRTVVIIASLLAIAAGVARVEATELYRDNVVHNDGNVMGGTELFGFGPFGGQGIWDIVEITVERDEETNDMAGLVAVNATQGGHGVAMHIAYDSVTGFPGHGLLQPGNVIRTSCWVALDPNSPLNRQDFQFAVIKIEFYSEELGAPDSPSRLFDSDIDTGGTIVESYAGLMSTSEWAQVVFEYEYNPAHFNAALLQEMRPVVVQGDFELKVFNGNSLVDNLIVEIFTNAAAAAASPVDTTPPGLLPDPFVFFEEDTVISAMGRTDTVLISFDGQPGVQYVLEYSETGPGGPWESTGLEISGDGTRQTVVDPAGPSDTRDYRIQVIDPEFAVPF